MSKLSRFFTIKGDRAIWYMVILLMLMSLLVIYSSTGRLAYNEQGGNTFFYLVKQLFFVFAGLVILLIFQRVEYTNYLRYANVLLGISFCLLLYARFAGAHFNGAGRWIRIPLIGFTFQPSEFAKISVVIYMAKQIAFAQEERWCNARVVKDCWPVAFLLVVIFWDNFSTFALVTAVCILMLFVGRVQWKTLLKLVGGLVFLSALFLGIIMLVPEKYLKGVGRVETVKGRIVDFVSGSDDVKGYSFQSIHARIAIANGGLIGKGPGNSVQRNFLPHPYSDFIYAIVIEEYGLLFGGGGIILIYLIILYRVGVIVRRSTRVFPAMLVLGLGFTILLQAMIHMGVCVGLLPVTGQTLPVVSMGGTSLFFTCVSFGIILSVSRSFSKEEASGEEVGGGE